MGNRLMLTALLFFLFAGNTQAELTVVATGVNDFALLSANQVICLHRHDDESYFEIVDLASGSVTSWCSDWNYEDDGWVSAGHIMHVAVSPNGKGICFTQFVKLHDDVSVPDEYFRQAVVIVLCRADGSDAQVVAVKNSPFLERDLVFTENSGRLVSLIWNNIEPNAAGYTHFENSDSLRSTYRNFNCINIEVFSFVGVSGLCYGNFFKKCPYNDNYYRWHGIDTIDEGSFYNFNDETINLNVSEFHSFEAQGLSGWVLPDAILAFSYELDEAGLLFIDGRFQPGPEYVKDWDIFCWLPDGSYILSEDNRQTIAHAQINWEAFEVEHATQIDDWPSYGWYKVISLPDSSGLLFLYRGNVYQYLIH